MPEQRPGMRPSLDSFGSEHSALTEVHFMCWFSFAAGFGMICRVCSSMKAQSTTNDLRWDMVELISSSPETLMEMGGGLP